MGLASSLSGVIDRDLAGRLAFRVLRQVFATLQRRIEGRHAMPICLGAGSLHECTRIHVAERITSAKDLSQSDAQRALHVRGSSGRPWSSTVGHGSLRADAVGGVAAGIVLPRTRVVLALAAPPLTRIVASLLPTFLRDWWGFFFA